MMSDVTVRYRVPYRSDSSTAKETLLILLDWNARCYWEEELRLPDFVGKYHQFMKYDWIKNKKTYKSEGF